MKEFFILLFILSSFQVLSAQTDFTNVANLKGIYHTSSSIRPGGGVSFCDFDGDGWDDLTITTGDDEFIQFYRNEQGTFVELSPLVPHDDEASHVLWVDFDNDGDKDLYVTTFDEVNRLYRNDGDLNFTDITLSAGFPLNDQRNFGACWGDFDRDGWLDLYYGERKFPIGTAPNENRLWHNNADGTFTEVTDQAGVADRGKIPFCSGFFDFNDDGWPDIYTANDKNSINTLLQNNGDGTFTDVSIETKTDFAIDAMNMGLGDYDNDGQEDIYVSNTQAGNILLRNLGPVGTDGQYQFEEVAGPTGVGFYGIGWGANWLDADLDQDLDLYVSGTQVGADVISSAFYLNENDGTFSQPMAGFVGDTVISFSNAIGDIDNDGDPDIIVANESPYSSQLWRNNSPSGNWLKIKLQGVLSNRDGIGAKVELYTNGQYQLRVGRCGSGFLGQNSSYLHFGLGANEMADSIRVTWPTGHVDLIGASMGEQILEIVEGASTNGVIDVDEDVSIVVSTNNLAIDQLSLQLFPNPSFEEISLDLPEDFQGQYLIANAQGQVIQTNRISTLDNRINVRALPTGLYFLSTWTLSGQRWSAKFEKL